MYATVVLILLALNLLVHIRLGVKALPRLWDAELGLPMASAIRGPFAGPAC